MRNIKFSKNHKNGYKPRKYYMIALASTKSGAPKGIRIPVASLKGSCPRPLDDGGRNSYGYTGTASNPAFSGKPNIIFIF